MQYKSEMYDAIDGISLSLEGARKAIEQDNYEQASCMLDLAAKESDRLRVHINSAMRTDNNG